MTAIDDDRDEAEVPPRSTFGTIVQGVFRIVA